MKRRGERLAELEAGARRQAVARPPQQEGVDQLPTRYRPPRLAAVPSPPPHVFEFE